MCVCAHYVQTRIFQQLFKNFIFKFLFKIFRSFSIDFCLINMILRNIVALKLLFFYSYSRALLLLRKKKFQEQVLLRADGQLENLERMIHDLEFAQVEMKVVDGLKVGNTALKQLHALLSIDEIEKVMDETREGIEKQREIDEVLTSTFATEEEIDESEIEAELDALMEADINEEAPEIPNDILLPNVPKDLPQEEEKEEKKRTKEKNQDPIAVMA